MNYDTLCYFVLGEREREREREIVDCNSKLHA